MYAKKILYTAATAPALGKLSLPILIINLYSIQCSCTKQPSIRIDTLMIKNMRLKDANSS